MNKKELLTTSAIFSFSSLLTMGAVLVGVPEEADAQGAVVIMCQDANSTPVPCVSTGGGTLQVGGVTGTVSIGGTLPVTVQNSITIVPSGTQTVAGTVAATGTISVAGTVPVSGTVVISNSPTVVPSGTQTVAGNVGVVPVTSGGLSAKQLAVANNITSVAVDASPGQLYGVEAFNNGTVLAYIKLYNAAQGSVTCGGTLTPVLVEMIPAPSSGGGGFISMNHGGVAFSTAITACITGGIANNDSAAPAASEYLVNFLYK